jgi:hypothetical protein
MPKQRQIPFLFAQKLASGQRVWHWKPSPRLRAAGFTNQKLGHDERAAVAAAIDLNAQVAAWSAGNAPAEAEAPRQRLPRVVRVSELMTRYRQSADFTDLRDKTKHEYQVRMRQIEHWALDGALPVRDITSELVMDLRRVLLEGSRFRAASILRVLRLILAFAERESIIPKGSNPAAGIRIPEPPARKTRMGAAVRDAIVESATELKLPDVVLAIELGFTMLQRRGDVLALTRMAWREIKDVDVDPRHVAVLANARGRVMGFRLQQQKTAAWVDAPLPPALHDLIEERWRDNPSGLLFRHPTDPSRPMPGFLFQRRFQLCRDVAAGVALMRGHPELAEAIDEVQFRDLRRTGMIFYKDAGATTQAITALSGHAVLGKKSILDTYMPGDTAGAMACVAAGVRFLAQQEKQEASEAV